MLDKKALGVEDKAMRPNPGDDEDTVDLPVWRCSNLACREVFPPGKRPKQCPHCGAAVEVVPPKDPAR